MRFVTFSDAGQARAGVFVPGDGEDGNYILDLAHPAYLACLGGVAPNLLDMIESGLDSIAEKIAAQGNSWDAARLAISSIKLLAPLPHPPRIVGAAHNYRCAIAERGIVAPDEPIFFEKNSDTVIGPDAPVILPAGAGGVTYEAEFAAVIGHFAQNVTVADAMNYVAGYTLFNDVSASEVIRRDGNFERGKNFPTFGPMGPWLVTPEEIDPVMGARVTLDIDGVLRQNGTTADLLFSIAEMISRLSRERPLTVGTVIATGTPAGVAPMQSPPTWLASGTVMTVAIEGLGRLSNPVQSEA